MYHGKNNAEERNNNNDDDDEEKKIKQNIKKRNKSLCLLYL